LVGILLAESYYFKSREIWRSALLGLSALALALIITTKPLTLATALCMLFLIYQGEFASPWIRAVFNWAQSLFGSRPSVFIADTSYGVYLIHLPVLWAIGRWLSIQPSYRHLVPNVRFLVFLTILLPIVYSLAYLMHKYVELPGIQFAKKFVRRRPAVRGEQGAIPQISLAAGAVEVVPP
jgi:peptidoglycan/LPS O-acetylase OafA/YrhL